MPIVQILKKFMREWLWGELTDEEFVQFAYLVILNRPADEDGFCHYVERLTKSGVSRKELVEILVSSDEFKALNIKYDFMKLYEKKVTICSSERFLPYVDNRPWGGMQLCELTNPEKWQDLEWLATLKDIAVIPAEPDRMHRKGYEWTQTAHGLRNLGILKGSRCLGVGTGHEPIIYWLANHADHVTATDLFDETSDWANDNACEGDPRVVADPKAFAPFPYKEENLAVLRMDGRSLTFKDESFDIVFSLSAIEHFGGHDEAAASMREMGRVLKPGGVAVVATELILNNARHKEFFTPEELLDYVIIPSRMKLIDAPTFQMSQYAMENPIQMPQERYYTPHVVLKEGRVLFTSVILFFRKG